MPALRRPIRTTSIHLPSRAAALLARWAAAWGLPQLAARTRVEVNPRLRRALARCRPTAGVIQLSARVVSGDGRRLFAEALCHEFAHLAVRARYRRRRTAPHGPEWKGLMVQAGFEPRARLGIARSSRGGGNDGGSNARGTRRAEASGAKQVGLRYLHRCPVCHASRVAGRPMPTWRCPECLHAGLDGTLAITSYPSRRPRP